VTTTEDPLPEDTEALKAALIETRAKLVGAQALIEHLQLVIEKMKREMFGPRSERSQRLLDQLELQLEELVAAAEEDEAKAGATRIEVPGFTRRPATRRNFPADLPVRRIVHPAPTACPCCGSSKLCKIGEDITKTLDVVPRQMVRDRTCAGEVQLPILRDDHTAAGTVPRDRTRLCRAEPAGNDLGRQILQSSAAQPAKRAICT